MIAIYGGTFDPIHIGHMRLASTAVSECGLDELIFMPAYVSPFKQGKKVSLGLDRLKMINLAISDSMASCITVSDYELHKEGPSYTIETLEHWSNKLDAQIAFVLGFDSLVQVDTWYRGDDILRRYPLISALRPDSHSSEDEYSDYADGLARVEEFRRIYGADIRILGMEPIDASSTEIRRLASEEGSITGLVSPSVEKYISENKLYSTDIKDYARYTSGDQALLEKLEAFMKKSLKPSRYIHSIGVEKMAARLANSYGIDADKARFAGRYHDIAKCFAEDRMNAYIDTYGISDEYFGNNALAHSKVGAAILANEFGVTDEDILNAVASHTTGRDGMSLLEEIIYVADAIEENREYDELPSLQAQALSDLDGACLFIMDYTIDLISSKGREVDMDTLAARNYIASRVGEATNKKT